MVLRELVVALGLEVDGQAFSAAEKAILALKSGAAGLIAAVGAVGVGLIAAAGYTANTADHIDELSQSLGVSSDELQRLSYAAGFSGLSMEQVGRSMKFLAKNGVKDARGELLRLSDQFSRMPDSTAKTALAIKKLGKTGADLIPMLNEGRAKLEEMFAEAPVMDPETIKSGVELSDAITRIQGALKKMVFMLGAPLLKPLGKLATALTVWFNANEKLIKSGLTEFVEHVIGVVEGLWSVVKTAAGGINLIVQAIGGWNVVLALAAARMGFLLISMNPVLAGLALFILILDDIAGYFAGKDSVTGDFLKGWDKLIKTMFAAPGWQDSEFVLALKWVGEKLTQLRDGAIQFARAGKAVTGKNMAGADAMTSTEQAANVSEFEMVRRLQEMRGFAPTVGDGNTKGMRPVNNVGKIEIKVDGSKDPKATTDAIKDELSAWLEPAHEVYS